VNNNSLQCWGAGESGQLGDGKQDAVTDMPQGVQISNPVTLVAGGRAHTCGLDKDGVVCWGANDSGQLGSAVASPQLKPVATGLLTAQGLALGADHSCALIPDGTVRCWGRNDRGQVGNGAGAGTPVQQPVPISAP
jgi:alpha-tubulin suppressor-like RCC1 family protein